MKHYFLLITITILFTSCGSDVKPPFVLPENTKQLIAGDSSKTWKLARRYNNKTRMNMGDCFLSYRATYFNTDILKDNNSDHEDCGASLSTNWSLYHDDDNYPYIKLKGGNLQELMHLDKDYKFFKIIELSDTLMILEFRHKQFSTKNTKIIDIYVPENVSVKNREFHW